MNVDLEALKRHVDRIGFRSMVVASYRRDINALVIPYDNGAVHVLDTGEVRSFDQVSWPLLLVIARHLGHGATTSEIERWAERFAPYVDDDNEWFYDGENIYGKDAQELGNLFTRLRVLGHGPEPLTREEGLTLFAHASTAWVGATNPVDAVDSVVRAVIDALPERFGVRKAGGGV